MAAVADREGIAERIEEVVADPSLDPTAKVRALANLRDQLRSESSVDDPDFMPLLGKIDSYTLREGLKQEAAAMSRIFERALVEEDADIRDDLLAQGVSAEELDAAGLVSHDDLDAAAGSEEISEAFYGNIAAAVRAAAAKWRSSLHPRQSWTGRFSEKPGEPLRLHGRGGGAVAKLSAKPHVQPPRIEVPHVPAPQVPPAPARPVEDYHREAIANLEKTSRTAAGKIDTSASKDKAKDVNQLKPEEAARLAHENLGKAIDLAHEHAHEQFTPESARALVEKIAKTVNGGILKEGVLIRQHDSDKFPYTKVADLEPAMRQFYEEFAHRLNDPNVDPVETAAWAEHRIDGTDHFFADGVGKTAKVAAAIPLMRHGLPLPQHRSRDEYYANAAKTRRGTDPQKEKQEFDKFHAYYRSVMPGGEGSAKPHTEEPKPPEPAPEVKGDAEKLGFGHEIAERLKLVRKYGLNDWPTKGALAKQLLGDAADTQELHTQPVPGAASPGLTGQQRAYTAERRKTHDQIVGEFLGHALEDVLGEHHPLTQKLFRGERLSDDEKQQVREAASAARGGEQPTALFMAGGPASGKSSALKASPELEPKGSVLINPDEIKDRLPEYRQMVQGGERFAAAGVHEESSDLGKRLQSEAMDLGLNVLVDGTGDSKKGKFAGKMKAMHDAGYAVDGLYVTLPTEEAVFRATSRAMQTGRWVPEPEIRSQHKNVSANFSDVAALPFMRDLKLFDNAGDGGPDLIAEAHGGDLAVHSQEPFDKFIAKAREGEPDAIPDVASLADEDLTSRWASLDRDLLPFAGNPYHPEARRIIEEQKAITKERHHRAKRNSAGAQGGPARDVVVIGAGPAGLSAAIYGGTEGLDTLMIDANPEPGGQIAMSSRVENVLGFPAGVTGDQYASDAFDQAQRVGADCRMGIRVDHLDHDPATGLKTLHLSNGETVQARSVIVAGGVQFRKLDFPGSDANGVVYGSSAQLKAATDPGDDVLMIGGANSAGQAALDVAGSGRQVTLMIRSGDVRKSMSEYLVQQLDGDPNVKIQKGEIAKVDKTPDGKVGSATLKDGTELPVSAVGLFIGSGPQTGWLDVERDDHGYVKVGGVNGPLETTTPGVFAAGDVRAGSVHRVITSAADGAAAIASVHGWITSQRELEAQAGQVEPG